MPVSKQKTSLLTFSFLLVSSSLPPLPSSRRHLAVGSVRQLHFFLPTRPLRPHSARDEWSGAEKECGSSLPRRQHATLTRPVPQAAVDVRGTSGRGQQRNNRTQHNETQKNNNNNNGRLMIAFSVPSFNCFDELGIFRLMVSSSSRTHDSGTNRATLIIIHHMFSCSLFIFLFSLLLFLGCSIWE